MSVEGRSFDQSANIPRGNWLPRALLVAAGYAAIGVVTAMLAGSADSLSLRNAWRLVAWVLCLAVYVAHVIVERTRAGSAPRSVAIRVASAVALGAFILAAAGPVRSHWASHDFWRASLLSLVVWPIILGIPAYVVTLAAVALLNRLTRPKPTTT